MTTLPKMCLLSMGMNIEVGNPEDAVSTTTIIPALYLYGGSTSKVRLTFTTLTAAGALSLGKSERCCSANLDITHLSGLNQA